MDLQVNMMWFASFGENQGRKHIFGSGSCQSIVVDLNLRDEKFNVFRGGGGGGLPKLTKIVCQQSSLKKNYLREDNCIPHLRTGKY